MKIENNNEIIFYAGEPPREIIRLSKSGDIHIHGKLTDNDKEVVNAMREFLISTGNLLPSQT